MKFKKLYLYVIVAAIIVLTPVQAGTCEDSCLRINDPVAATQCLLACPEF